MADANDMDLVREYADRNSEHDRQLDADHPTPTRWPIFRPFAPSPRATMVDQLHTKYLARASDSLFGKDVLPGGENFGVCPPDCGAPPGKDSPFEHPGKSSSQLRLSIRLSHESCWAFEPIEMDLNLMLSEGRGKCLTISKEIDPAFESFQIWLTNPEGERRIFRADSRICQSNGKLTIDHGNPFRRDISLLRELGRATFSSPGNYEVQAMVRMKNGKIVPSNIARCKIKSPEHG